MVVSLEAVVLGGVVRRRGIEYFEAFWKTREYQVMKQM
jgi:hypothetical protein